jgi:O-antigen/teichoic acid export membrane protein
MKSKEVISAGVITVSKLITGIMVAKGISTVYGAEAFGVYGQLYSIVWLVALVAGGGINNALVRFVSSSISDKTEQSEYLFAGFIITSFFSVTMLLVFLFFTDDIIGFFPDVSLELDFNLGFILFLLSFMQILFAFNNFFLFSITGLGENYKVAIVHVIGSVLGGGAFFCLLFISFQWALIGYMIVNAIYIFPSAILFINNFKSSFVSSRIDKVKLKNMLNYSVITISGIVSIPLVQIYYREQLAVDFDWHNVGYWLAVTRFSDLFMLFLTTLLTTTFLPKIARADIDDIAAVTFSAFKTIVPLLAFFCVGVYFLREYLILLLYDESLLPATDFFLYQLVGDAFKVVAFIFGYIVVARSSVKENLFFQFFQVLLYALLAEFLFPYGVKGLVSSYMITYIVYFGLIYAYSYRRFLR